MSKYLKTLLSIAGSDPCGGAGVQTDIRCGSSMGLHVCTAITALTAQNSRQIISINPVDVNAFRQQLGSVMEEVVPDAVKIGMLGSTENAKVVGDFFRTLPPETHVVVDPVLKASVGQSLSSQNAPDLIDIYISSILPFADVVTPNLCEAHEILKAIGVEPDENPESLVSQLLQNLESDAVILKGGHSDGSIVTDYLADNFDGVYIVSKSSHSRIECQNLHGTGCAYSSFMASFLALGFPLNDAFLKTSTKLHEIISGSCTYKLGTSSYGPLNINNYYI